MLGEEVIVGKGNHRVEGLRVEALEVCTVFASREDPWPELDLARGV